MKLTHFQLFSFSFDDDGVFRYYGVEGKNILKSVPVIATFCTNPAIRNVRKLVGRLDTTQYKRFLEEVVAPAAMETPKKIQVVHDRYPVHHARAVLEWFAANGEKIETLPWPGSFGDIMPLEKTWDDTIEHIRKRSQVIVSHDQLWKEIQQVWEEMFDNQYVKDLVADIPRKLRAIIVNDGEMES